MTFYLLQAIPEQAWEITPYNATAYAAIVILLGFLAITFYRAKEKSDEKRFEVIERTTALLTLVEENLDHDRQMQGEGITLLRENKRTLDDILREIRNDNSR